MERTTVQDLLFRVCSESKIKEETVEKKVCLDVKVKPSKKPAKRPRLCRFHCYACDMCGKTTTSNPDEHIKRFHMSDTLIFCEICDYSTNLIEQLKQHNFNKHENQTKIAPRNESDKLRETVKALKIYVKPAECNHATTPAPIDPVKRCRVCKTEIWGQTIDHARKFHQKDAYILCPLCPVSSRNEREPVLKHMKIFHPELTSTDIIDLNKETKPMIHKIRDFCFDPKLEDEQEYLEGLAVRNETDPFEEEKVVIWKLEPRVCNLCGSKYPTNKFISHSREHFVQENPSIPAFRCHYCQKFECSDEDSIAGHIHKLHPLSAQGPRVVHIPDERKGQLSQFLLRCFGFDYNQWPIESYERHEQRIKELRRKFGRITPAEQIEKPPEMGFLTHYPCALCGAEMASKQFNQHVANKHFGTPLISCPICGKTEKYQRRNMVMHIARTHPDKAKAQPIDRRKEFHDQIRDLVKKCFLSFPHYKKVS